MKQAYLAIVIATFVGCQPTKDLSRSKSLVRICVERNAVDTVTPEGFKVTPAQAIEKARPFFVENPFELLVFADSQDYYVDIAWLCVTERRVRERGIRISGQTGEALRGEERTFGK